MSPVEQAAQAEVSSLARLLLFRRLSSRKTIFIPPPIFLYIISVEASPRTLIDR